MASNMPMPMVAPLFAQDRQFSSTLGMVNASNVSTFADVALTDLSGRQIAVKRVQFTPHSQQHLDIFSVLESSVSPATTGRLTVSQDPSLQGMAISAQLSMTFTGARNTNYIDEEVAMPSAEGSQTVRAVTDESDGSPLVAITSISDTTQHIEVLCIVEHEHLQKSIQLGPQETLVTEACEAKTRPGWDLQAILDHAEETPRRVAGISISSDGMPGSFAAFGLSRRTKKGHQSFSSIDFSDPMMTMSPNTVFSGIPVGATPLLGEGKFVPELSLANFSVKSRHVTVKFAHTSGATPATSDVADLSLEAGTIKHLKLAGLEADPTLKNSFFVGSDGAPGDLLAKLVSVNDSDSEMQVVGILGKDEREMNNGGNHPWSIEHGNDSTILLFNHCAKPQPFYLLISGNSVQWQKTYALAPMQTEAISVRQLIEDQTKDDNGKVLPKNVQSGQVGWWNQDMGLGKGRLLLSNRENGMARNFSCSTLRGLCGIIYNQQITTFANGNTVIFASAIALVCEVYAVNQCNGTADTGTGGYSTSWSSQNPAIASISGPSNQSNVNLYGAGAGSTTANVTISSPYCSRTAGGPANVCDFYIIPYPPITAQSCSTVDTNLQHFTAKLTSGSPSSCTWYPSGSSGSFVGTPTVEEAEGQTHCDFTDMSATCDAYYHAGPKQSDGTAGGGYTLSMTIKFSQNSSAITRNNSGSVVCP